MPKKKRRKREKVPSLTWEEIEALLKKGARRAAALDKVLRKVFQLTPEQLRQPLD